NALIPVITISALQMGQLLAGAVLTEQVFTIPGFGRLIVDSVYNRDYGVVQGVVLTTATIYMLLNLAADLAYAVADPRIRRCRPCSCRRGSPEIRRASSAASSCSCS